MPYAAHKSISTSPLAGGITITDAQYALAIAAMTDKANPRKVSVANGFQLVAPSTPEPVALMQAFTLPSLGNRFPVNTGLARHPSGVGWLCGDDGRNLTGNVNDGGVIWYNEDFTQVLANFKSSAMGMTTQHSIQGVAAVPGTNDFWCVARFIGNTSSTSRIIKCNATTGAAIWTGACPNSSNAIAVVPEDNQHYSMQTNGVITRWNADGNNAAPSFTLPNAGQADALHYLGSGKFLATYGGNGANGTVAYFSIIGNTLSVIRTVTIPGATAIEGVAIHDGFIWVNNDGEYHGQSPALNRVLKYSLGSLLD